MLFLVLFFKIYCVQARNIFYFHWNTYTEEIFTCLYIKSVQTLATVHETFYHLQYIYIFTQNTSYSNVFEITQNSSSGSGIELRQ